MKTQIDDSLYEIMSAAEKSAQASKSFKSKLLLRHGDFSTPDLTSHTSPLSTPGPLMRSGTLSEAMRLSPESRQKVRFTATASYKKPSTLKRVFLKSRKDEEILNTLVSHKPKATPAKPSSTAKPSDSRASSSNENVTVLNRKLAESREHYKILEKKYRELKSRNLSPVRHIEGLSDRPSTTDLYSELRASPSSIDHYENSAIKELLGLILAEVRDVKARVSRLEEHLLSSR
jgi:hypothetical protein